MSNLLAGFEQARTGGDMLAMAAPDVSTVLRVGGGLLTLATIAAGSIKAFHQIPEKHVGIRTFNGRARDKEGKPLHELLRTGGHWMLPFLHDVKLINLQAQVVNLATTFDVESDTGREQFNLAATATWAVMIDLEGDPDDAFQVAYDYYYGLDEFEDVQRKVTSRAERFLVDCASSLPDNERTFRALSQLATERLEETGDLFEYGVGISEIELNAFHRAGVIQFGNTRQTPVL